MCVLCVFVADRCMLDSETKARIDSARDILVGKVPDPKSQVEQITIALIYKFMNDMDRQSEDLGGKATFFSGEYKKYAWNHLLDNRLGGHERLILYAEGIEKMNESKNIPQLFRDIFRGVFLPYRDPETLNLFLKEINGFTYDHSERLGDAFEYLLSVMDSQGDAGQFRTPRHIIHFMVQVIDPQKHETILDPACATAGFLISSYKHILTQNTKETPGDLLTADDRGRLMTNFCGYDISPDMVRLSRVNLYLHGFANPRIYEYDTLTSEERWDERCDIIMANPPFMTPKGGIRPHNRFSIKATRSEVLFVDYIAEHLNPGGRAGVIVPEGIIFQSQNAYKKLRRMLVENYLWAVVSLPAGVFNPYSGVKTSILFLDRNLANRMDEVLFVKVGNDGFDLGAQRRPIGKNDLPEALKILIGHKEGHEIQENGMSLCVSRKRLLANPDCNLSGERYRQAAVHPDGKWPMVALKDVCSFEYGESLPESSRTSGPYPVVGSNGIVGWHNKFLVTGPVVVIGRKGSVGEVSWIEQNCTPIDTTYYVTLKDSLDCDQRFFYYILQRLRLKKLRDGAGVPGLNRNDAYELNFPLPPLDVQKQIVADLEGYRKIIEGARQVIANYKPTIRIDASWPTVNLGEAPIEIIDGDRGVNYPKKEEFSESGHCLFLNTSNVRKDGFKFDELQFVSRERDAALRKGKLIRNDVVLTTRGTVGNVALYDYNVPFEHIRINSGMLILRLDSVKIEPGFLYNLIQTGLIQKQFEQILSGCAQPQLPIRSLVELTIPIPPITDQRQIVAQLEAEKALVESNRKLIEIFEAKIKSKLGEVWGENDHKGQTD